MKIITPRWYQTPLINDTYAEWNAGHRNVAVIAPCGSGKTYTAGFIAREFNNRNQYSVQFAHRDVLLSQLSLSFATLGIRHNLVCNNKAKKFISNLHVEELGESFYDDRAHTCVASIRTWYNKSTINIDNKVGLWLQDECHHLLRDNQAGKVVSGMERAYGVGFTATFCRLDRKGLGRVSHGVFDAVVEGPTTGDLIESGDLSRYRIIATPLSHDIHREMRKIKQGTEYDAEQKRMVLNDKRKNVVGDVVGTYKKFANGLRGITFCQDIDACEAMAAAYRAAGVPAVALSSRSDPADIWQGIRDFKAGRVWQLVNCMLFGEGFDVPACECASFVNPTKSYGKFVQEFMRACRRDPNNPDKIAFIFDHVGNIEEHGLPDHGLVWEDYLYAPADRPKRKNDTDSTIKLTTCTNPECMSDYQLPASHCPWCGTPYAVTRRPLKQVDGELVELSEADLERLRGERRVINAPEAAYRKYLSERGVPRPQIAGMVRSHLVRQQVHEQLSELINQFAIRSYNNGLSVPQARQQFGVLYGHTIDEAHAMKTDDARKLIERLSLTTTNL